jgi:hypothetical protein
MCGVDVLIFRRGMNTSQAEAVERAEDHHDSAERGEADCLLLATCPAISIAIVVLTVTAHALNAGK